VRNSERLTLSRQPGINGLCAVLKRRIGVAECGIGFLISRKSTEKFAGIMQPVHDTLNKTEVQT
jgi:hypothetical protein